MNIIRALYEIAKAPLAAGYFYGFVAIVVGVLIQAPALSLVGGVAMLTALLVALVIALAG